MKHIRDNNNNNKNNNNNNNNNNDNNNNKWKLNDNNSKNSNNEYISILVVSARGSRRAAISPKADWIFLGKSY